MVSQDLKGKKMDGVTCGRVVVCVSERKRERERAVTRTTKHTTIHKLNSNNKFESITSVYVAT